MKLFFSFRWVVLVDREYLQEMKMEGGINFRVGKLHMGSSSHFGSQIFLQAATKVVETQE